MPETSLESNGTRILANLLDSDYYDTVADRFLDKVIFLDPSYNSGVYDSGVI